MKRQLDVVQKYAKQLGSDINEFTSTGETLLIKALHIRMPHLPIVQELFCVPQIDPEIRDKRLCEPALFFALSCGDSRIWDLFLTDNRTFITGQKLNINAKDSEGNTILLREVAKGGLSTGRLEKIMAHPDIDFMVINYAGETVFSLARQKDKEQNHRWYIVPRLLDTAYRRQQETRAEQRLQTLLQGQKKVFRRQVARARLENWKLKKQLGALSKQIG